MGRRKARRGGRRGPDPFAIERQQAWEERQSAICDSKSSWASETEARKAAGWVKANNPGSRQMRVYLCQSCGRWHLTNRGVG